MKYKKLDLSFVYLNEPEDLVSLLVLLSGSILAANDADKNEFTWIRLDSTCIGQIRCYR